MRERRQSPKAASTPLTSPSCSSHTTAIWSGWKAPSGSCTQSRRPSGSLQLSSPLLMSSEGRALPRQHLSSGCSRQRCDSPSAAYLDPKRNTTSKLLTHGSHKHTARNFHTKLITCPRRSRKAHAATHPAPPTAALLPASFPRSVSAAIADADAAR